MAITRANAEAVLVGRLGALMEEANLDGTTVDGTNEDLNDPIGVALRAMGYSVTDIAAVADGDLASLGEEEFNEFLDRAELRTLESIEGNFVLVDITAGPRSEKFSQLLLHVRERKVQLTERVQREYGSFILEGGYISIDLAEHGSDE
jgi:hypothetical protein